MKGDSLLAPGELDLPGLDQLLDQHRVRSHLVARAQLRVVAGEAVVAVGAQGNDLGNSQRLEVLDVLLRQLDEEQLVAHLLGGIPGASSVFQNPEGDAGRLEDSHRRPRDLLCPLLVGDRAADPEQVFRLALLEDRDIQIPAPVVGAGGGSDEGLLPALEILLGVSHHLGELGPLHDEVPTELQDALRLADADRAGLHAGGTGDAVEGGLHPDGLQQCVILELLVGEVLRNGGDHSLG